MRAKPRYRPVEQDNRELNELWELVQLAEEEGLVREPMELRRLFAEGECRLDGASLRTLGEIARKANLMLAAAWCEREIRQADTTPGFIQRIRTLFETRVLETDQEAAKQPRVSGQRRD